MRGAALATAASPITAMAASTARFDAHLEGGRGEQLGDVGVEHLVGGGDLGEAEVDEPGPPVGGEQHVGEAQVAVGDAMRAQLRDALPDLRQHRVRDGLVCDAVERVAGGALVGEQEAVVADARP